MLTTAAAADSALAALCAEDPHVATPGSRPAAAVFLLLAAGARAAGFRVQEVNETPIEGQQQGQQQEQQVQQEQEPQLIALPGWDDSPDAFSYTLRHPRSSLRFLLKLLPLGAQVLATAVPQPVEGGSSDPQKVATCEFVLADEVDAGALPGIDSADGAVAAWDRVFKRPGDLLARFFRQVISEILPGLFADGPQQEGSGGYPQQQQQPPLPRDPRNRDPLMVGPGPQYPPGYGSGFGVGGGDLDPFGGAAPSHLGPFGPYGNHPIGGPMGGPLGPGMHVGPQHPGFGRGGGPLGPDDPFALGPHGHPPPPGARFDPIYPHPPPNGGHEPGPDHLRPPGGDDSYFM
jgi:proteasome inhibitor subunit 1 (PI31)